jgi:hypothetical protein
VKRKISILLIGICVGAVHNLWAQSKTYFKFEELNEKNIQQVRKEGSKEGWIIIEKNNEKYLVNFSNAEYTLFFGLNCEVRSNSPYFLVEYTDKYRDGDFAGIDFISSSRADYDKVDFLVDKQNFGNPFKEVEHIQGFEDALKAGKLLTINVYMQEAAPEATPEALSLIRTLKFKINNPELLNEAIYCYPVATEPKE